MLKKPVPQGLPTRGLTKRANAILRQIFGVFPYKVPLYVVEWVASLSFLGGSRSL